MILLTPQIWSVRRGPDLHAFGDRYEDTAIITRAGDTAYIEAWSGARPSREEIALVRNSLRLAGFRFAAWERRKDGCVRYVRFAL